MGVLLRAYVCGGVLRAGAVEGTFGCGAEG